MINLQSIINVNKVYTKMFMRERDEKVQERERKKERGIKRFIQVNSYKKFLA